MDDSFIPILLPIFLYAETHYSFKGIYSRIKKKEPEIIADVPYRVNPGQRLPILLLVKDAHRYPIQFRRVSVTIQSESGAKQNEVFDLKNVQITSPMWWKILPVNTHDNIRGPGKVMVDFEILSNSVSKHYTNDNYRISSHEPFETYFANTPLPKFPHWYFGDLHYHSAFTSDQVEFGAPIGATVQMAKALGFNFFAATDHSYDLDDEPDNPLQNDKNLPKWRQLQTEVTAINKSEKNFVVFPGEELSCGNSRGRNIHLLLLNESKFFEGYGDSAEKWLHTKPQHALADVLPQLHPDSLAFAAHPEDRTPLLQWILIRRGRWRSADYAHERLNGMQIFNGKEDAGFNAAKKRWVNLLLSGKKLNIIAGNDGHGNFNRFRQIGFPFFTMREHQQQIFGGARTGIKCEGRITLKALSQALRSGRCVVTTGPMLEMLAFDDKNECYEIGGSVCRPLKKIIIKGRSTDEFGKLKNAILFAGVIGAPKEKIIWSENFGTGQFYFEKIIKPRGTDEFDYFRAEVFSLQDKERRYCLTNPIWIRNSSAGNHNAAA